VLDAQARRSLQPVRTDVPAQRLVPLVGAGGLAPAALRLRPCPCAPALIC